MAFPEIAKIVRYFNGLAIVKFSRIPAVVLSINLVLYSKDLKLLLFSILVSNQFASSLE